MDSPSVKTVSECFVKPESMPEDSKQAYHLSHFDLAMISVQYIQKGHLFRKPKEAHNETEFMNTLLQKLRDSLSIALVHFYPLAGRLVTSKAENPKCYSIFVDCNDSPGARFIHATTGLSVSDILGSKYVPLVVQSFFDHHKAVNHDGHEQSLLSVKVTELVDGIFIGLSMNHAMGDGSSFWSFFSSWSEIFRAQESDKNGGFRITNPPALRRWFPEGRGPILGLPFNHPDEFIRRYESPVLKERMFHFSSETIRRLKSQANQECGTTMISSFQSLTAFMWRSVTRARRLPLDQETSCRVAANNRSRMKPPLSGNYFGNCISAVRTSSKAGDLLENGLGGAALKVHRAVVGHTSEKIDETIDHWFKSPYVYHIDRLFEPLSIMMGSSPRFDKYGCEFGMGKAVTLRSGYSHKFDGKVSAYPGREGGGSIDLEVCLVPEFMEALESDQGFMSLVSS
ncbi:PREDICTED: uncharacterized acetyltransferase At3g50280-like [Tarenaya hassleriana]|uniref:uncharacterized acetyltransferase At3g50280-like n=1 Tax=Tarenaya hassleriana TaxID=28532 RepID=UPI00053C86E5|nr:PREDICTED: uncharacterized acetyltransferase At3g50280-like [Tarenaya hassleriana]